MISEDKLRKEVILLSELIDEGFKQHLPMNELCVAFCALNWALNPEGFSAPTDRYGKKPKPVRTANLKVIK